MKQVTINLYSFEELTPKAQEKAISEFCDINVDHDWWSFVYDDISNLILDCFGQSASITAFDLGRRQELEFDGLTLDFHNLVHFVESKEKDNYPDFLKKISSLQIPEKLNSLHWGVKDLFESGELEIQGTRQKYCTSFYCNIGAKYAPNVYNHIQPLCTALDDLMDNIKWYALDALKIGYEYLTSEEQIKETLISNEYEFTEDGAMYF